MIKGKFRRGFNVSYDPKFLFSCDFISIPYSEAAQAFGLLSTSSFFLILFSVPASFFPSDFSDSGWRMAWFGIGSWLREIPFGSGSLRIVSA